MSPFTRKQQRDERLWVDVRRWAIVACREDECVSCATSNSRHWCCPGGYSRNDRYGCPYYSTRNAITDNACDEACHGSFFQISCMTRLYARRCLIVFCLCRLNALLPGRLRLITWGITKCTNIGLRHTSNHRHRTVRGCLWITDRPHQEKGFSRTAFPRAREHR